MTEQPKGFSTAREKRSQDAQTDDGGRPSRQPGPTRSEAEAPRESEEEGVEENVGLESISSLERLRDRVEVASREMSRLQKENRALAERIEELESRPSVDPHGTVLSLDHDPDVLKRKISGFIEAIDSYLEKERRRP